LNAVGITIAKKNSRRLPGKNMRMFCGKPLLEWTMLQLTSSRWIADYWLVTDDEEQAKLAEKYHFHVAWQETKQIEEVHKEYGNQGKMGGPYAFKIGLDAAQEFGKTQNLGWKPGTFDVVVALLPTQVLRKPGDIDGCIELWLQHQEIPVITAVNYKDFTLYTPDDAGTIKPRHLDLWGNYWEGIGNVWVGNPDQYIKYSFAEDGHALTPEESLKVLHYRHFPVALWQRFDIDTQEDWDISEHLFEKNILQGKGEKAYTDYKEFVLSEYGYEQHAASYNKGVEQNLLPAEYRNSFFNHLPVYLECMKTDPEIVGYELVEKRENKKGQIERKVMKHIKARNGSDVFAPENVLKEPQPALIIGSGPSFDKAAPLLKDWKGGIFCSTSQGSTLVYYGADPTHMVAYDINTTPSEFDWADKWAGRRTVLVTHPGMHPSTIDHWPGRRCYFKSMDTSNFFFTNVLPVAYGDVIPSHMFLFSCSVAAQMSLAHAMGYSPLFFVGCDFLADRFCRWRYDHEKKEWISDPQPHGIFNNKGIKSANGLISDPLQVFYKRSTLCVWRIDGSKCFQTTDKTIISEMPMVPIEEVVAKQGLGFDDRYPTRDEVNDTIEKYLARFNQFVLRFEPDAEGRESYRILESHQRGDWKDDVLRYMTSMAQGLKDHGLKPRIDLDKNIKRFVWLKEQVAGDATTGN